MLDNNEPENTGNAGGADRRLVIKSSLATLAALGGAGFMNLSEANAKGALTDVNILNFALNLEYLEAEFYLRAAYGHGLDSSETTGTGRQGTVTGGSMVPFQNDAIRSYALEIAADERAHVDFLRSALGDAKIAEPTIDLQNSFNTLAKAAGIGDSFDPFASETNFLIGAFVFEDVGVTAYHGAARYIQNKDYLDAAAGILAVEAYHAGIIRAACAQAKVGTIVDKISVLRNKLSGKGTTDQGIYLGNTGYDSHLNLVPADANSIAFERTPDEVLNIVYAGGKKGDFGFFPAKVNGKIR